MVPVIVGVTMVKDEADIIGQNLAHLLAEGVDHIIVADNLSSDGTRDILCDLAKGNPVSVLDDFEVAYYQSRKMTALAHRAGGMGADWIIPFDADELFYGCAGSVRDALSHCDADVLEVSARRHIPHPADADDPNPITRMKHRNTEIMAGAKVAFRYHPSAALHMGNHNVDHPGRCASGVLELREWQYRSFDHFVRKVRNGKAAYDATDLPEGCGIHWRKNGALDDEGLRAEWGEYLRIETVFDPAPARRDRCPSPPLTTSLAT